MAKPDPKYTGFESYRNGWDAFCYDRRNPEEHDLPQNPYHPNFQKFSHDCWCQGYMDSTGDYVVWGFE